MGRKGSEFEGLKKKKKYQGKGRSARGKVEKEMEEKRWKRRKE